MLKEDSGAYAILLHLTKSQKIQISKLGDFEFPEGFYVYSGSAKKNLGKRIGRHLRKDNKKLKWHIDFFIKNSYVKQIGYWAFIEKEECPVNRFFKTRGGSVVVKNFGSSDCRENCESHLLYLGTVNRLQESAIKKAGGINGRMYIL
jgi:Uri superfamily endonuclease